jgi:opacity protein-like surface antigen
MGRLTTFTQAAFLAIVAATPAGAADLLKYNYQPRGDVDAVETPVELGTGWYLRGDAAWTQDKGGQLSPDVAGSLKQNAWQVDFGVGYKWNEWFRTDLTFGFHKTMDYGRTGAKVTCPYGAHGLSTQGATPIQLGYLWDSQKETCSPVESASMRRQELMLNGYIDLGTWYSVTPYVGAGVGVAKLTTTGSLQYYKTSDNTVYNADLTPTGTYPFQWIDVNGNLIVPQPSVSFAKQDWTRRINATSYNFAWALMGGVAVDLTSRAKLDIGYRYSNLGKFTSATSPLTGKSVTTTLTSQEVHVGFRYMVD